MVGIPEFIDGRLPPGLHRASRDEIVERFCSTTAARVGLQVPLDELIVVARESGAIGLYLNGSFVTDKLGPRDIDAVIVLSRDFDLNGPYAARLRVLHRDYGLDIERVAADDLEERDYLLNEFFGTDRDGVPRGLVEVIL